MLIFLKIYKMKRGSLMKNNLKFLKQQLKSFAKRVKDFKYSHSALIAFLLTGAVGGGVFSLNLFSAEKEVETQIETISVSDVQLKKQFKELSEKNNRFVNNSNLKLIQLMEQGDHVVKSPWSSWQYGINLFYDNWRGKYKGYGGKVNDVKYDRNETVKEYKYNTVSLASPLVPKTNSLNTLKNLDLSSVSDFTLKTVEKSEGPVIQSPKADVKLTLKSKSKGSWGIVTAMNNHDSGNGLVGVEPNPASGSHTPGAGSLNGVFEGVTVLNGNIEANRHLTTPGDRFSTWNYKVTNLGVKNTSTNNVTSSSLLNGLRPNDSRVVDSYEGEEYKKNGFFQTSGNSHDNLSTSFIMNGANVRYTSAGDSKYVEELVHQDVHGGMDKRDVEAAINNSFPEFLEDFKDIENINMDRNGMPQPEHFNVFGNKGTIDMYGSNIAFSNSYAHLINDNIWDNVTGVIMNRGTINLNSNNPKNAIFVVSPDVYDVETPQIFYNGDKGKVTTESPETAMFFFQNSKPTADNIHSGRTYRKMAAVNKGNLVMNGKNSAGVYLSEDSNNDSTIFLNFSDVKSSGDSVMLDDTITNPTVSYITKDGKDMVNELDSDDLKTGSGVENHANPIVMRGNKSIGMYMPVTKAFVNGVFAVKLENDGKGKLDTTTGVYEDEGSVGIYTNAPLDLQGHYIDLDGSKVDAMYNVGVYPITADSKSKDSVVTNLGYGKIKIEGGKSNVGILLKSGNNGVVHSESEMELSGGERNTAIYAEGHNTGYYRRRSRVIKPINTDVSVRSISTVTPTMDNIFIYAADGAHVKTHSELGGLNIESKINTANPVVAYDASHPSTTGQTTGAVYATGSKTLVDISRDAKNNFKNSKTDLNINITGAKVQKFDTVTGTYRDTGKYTGFGLYADNNATIKATNNNISVVNGSTAVTSVNGANIDLKESTVYYKGNGYALYTDGKGEIDITNGTLKLDGNAVGYVRDLANPNSGIDFKGTTIEALSDDVVLVDLKDTKTGTINLNVGNGTLKSDVLGLGVISNPVIGATKYKYASIDKGNITINNSVDKGLVTASGNSDSEVFTNRLLYKNSVINVTSAGGVKANLNSQQIASIDSALSSPIGLSVSASENSTSINDTQINNDGKIEANRTDAGTGAVGLYVSYGKIHNQSNGDVKVETINKNNNAVGIYGTSSTEITNDGTVTVGGKKSFGILGLSYRLDKSGNVVNGTLEPFANAGDLGKVEITNNKTINMSDDSAIGIYVLNNSDKTSAVRGNNETWAKNTATGVITINGNDNAIGMAGSKATLTNEGKIDVNGTKSIGMYGEKDSKLINSGKINVNRSSYGIFGENVEMTAGEINVADDGVGVYSTGPSVNLSAGKIDIANNNAVGVYIADSQTSPAATSVNSKVEMVVGDANSFGYVIAAKDAKTDLVTHAPNDVHIGEKSTYIYSAAPQSLGGKITNYSNIVTNKDNAYGIYSSQDSENYGNIDLTSGKGNVGIYSTEGIGRNYGTIEVGKSDEDTKQYGIGMATGYYNETARTISNTGTVENFGTINVTQENSVGMYAIGSGSKAINRGTINLSGRNTIGMYIDREGIGENYGTIQTVPTSNGAGIKGIVVANGGILKNYGTIKIVGNDNIGVSVFRDSADSSSHGLYEEYGSNISTNPYVTTDSRIVVSVLPTPLPSMASMPVAGMRLVPTTAVGNTGATLPQTSGVLITDPSGLATLNLAASQMGNNYTISNNNSSSIGMYVDTSGINYTHPIQGLNNVPRLANVDLVMGIEATKNSNSKSFEIGDNILRSYNNEFGLLPPSVSLNAESASLTWRAKLVNSGIASAPIKAIYLEKIPYTEFASKDDVDTEKFLDGLEQRYGVEDINSREKQIFNKMNDLLPRESHTFAQAVKEMKGYEYSNTQQRIYETGNDLDKEFKYLWKEWRNPSKQNNKIKIFGMKNEYNTDTAGIIDYDSNAYGVAYVHEDETVKLGNSSGWYAGAITNRFKFKDLGKSTEQNTMIKAGIFKTMSPYEDHNGSLRWTIAGDVFGGINNMRRKFWVVDDTFESKGNYYTYGAAFKTDLGYDIRLSERTHLRPYGALKMEYGRFTNINEDRGEMSLEVKGNDYFSVKPEAGVEFKYIQPFGVRSQLSVGVSAAYENELGKLNRLNQARVKYTTADWYNLRNEKEDRKGSGKLDLNFGIDNTRLGFTANLGYDTKGKNVRGGLGFRLIY